jgi:alanine-glyoxylate transaminase/serine-glyoxylate transaminase/serine-pyruvate transaminase
MANQKFVINNNHRIIKSNQKSITPKLLLGPGPSNISPQIRNILAAPQITHRDPAFISAMNEMQTLLRYIWQTNNAITLPVSGTGTAGMETCLKNIIEPGDVVLVGVIGFFGERLVEMAKRCGADVRRINGIWGTALNLQEIYNAIEIHKPVLFALVQAETSTGVYQPLDTIGNLCHNFDCLFLVDAVGSLGGIPIFIDDWDIDVAFSCSQKCIGGPPGLAPITMSERVLDKIRQRKTKTSTYYFDIMELQKYWNNNTYHHTIPTNLYLALHESLRSIADEGLEMRWHRHTENAELLWNGLNNLGLECFVEKNLRLTSLTSVLIPAGIDRHSITQRLLAEYNIEIGYSMGKIAKKIWRIGLMGFNSQRENVLALLGALENLLSR